MELYDEKMFFVNEVMIILARAFELTLMPHSTSMQMVEVDIPPSLFEEQGRQLYGAQLLQIQVKLAQNPTDYSYSISNFWLKRYSLDPSVYFTRLI